MFEKFIKGIKGIPIFKSKVKYESMELYRIYPDGRKETDVVYGWRLSDGSFKTTEEYHLSQGGEKEVIDRVKMYHPNLIDD